MELLFLEGDRGLYAIAPFEHVYFPDRESNIKEPGIYECEITLDKDKYGFVRDIKRIVTDPSVTLGYHPRHFRNINDEGPVGVIHSFQYGGEFREYRINPQTTVFVDPYLNVWYNYIDEDGDSVTAEPLYTTHSSKFHLQRSYKKMIESLKPYEFINDEIRYNNLAYHIEHHTLKYGKNHIYPYLAILSCMNVDGTLKYRFGDCKQDLRFDVIGDFVCINGEHYGHRIREWYDVKYGAVYAATDETASLLNLYHDRFITDNGIDKSHMLLDVTYKEIVDFRRSNLISGKVNLTPSFNDLIFSIERYTDDALPVGDMKELVKQPVLVKYGTRGTTIHTVDPRMALGLSRVYDEDELMKYLNSAFLTQSKEDLMAIQKAVSKSGVPIQVSQEFRTDDLIGYVDI